MDTWEKWKESFPKTGVEGFPDSGGGWIATYGGRYIYPLDPDPSVIQVDDIAHALANQCRFTGHTRKFYSVAQHCYLASVIVPPKFALEALLHDASEAYISDIARPVKRAEGFGEFYKVAEERLERAIAERFGTPFPMSPEVKEADEALLWAEMRDLMPCDPPEDAVAYPTLIEPWAPEQAESYYLKRYYQLNPNKPRGQGMMLRKESVV